jgi:type IV fimbrial biogenesis protein FimT
MPSHSQTLPAKQHAGGFTLIELMVTVIVLVIVVTTAAPSMIQLVTSQRTRNAAADLASAVTLTRSEAVNRNTTITMAASGSGGSWSGGWAVTAGTQRVRGYGPFDGITITASGGSSLTVGNDGRPTAGTQTFQVAPATNATNATTLCVQVSGTGRVATVNGACT